MTPDIDDHGEHNKEVFAYFGRAYYMANVFETGLAIAIMQLAFLSDVIEQLKREGRTTFNQARYEADFDTFMQYQHAQTLGNLLKSFEKIASVDTHLKALVSEAKVKRDHLAHHYFRERGDQLMTRSGRDAMIAELDAAATLFKAADTALDKFLEPRRVRLGIRSDRIEAEFLRYKQSLIADE